MDNVLISVIVPAYNVETTIAKCLDSILNQSYKNIEIIVVNDGSTDSTKDIVLQYCSNYHRVSLINHEKNRGLFLARISGVKKAKGEYIGFVDSDDYVSRDYYRGLLNEAINSKADIVVAKIVHEDAKGYQYVHNIYEDFNIGLLKENKIWESYWEQEGQLFIWHTVWNKIYSAKLWKKALPVLSKMTDHLIMAEDFVFSSVLIYYAKILSSVEYSRYYYYQNSNASTALTDNVFKFQKNIGDLIKSFSFVRDFLISVNVSDEVMEHFSRWESLYMYFWNRNVVNSKIDENNKTKLINLLNSGMSATVIPTSPDYFYSVSTQFDRRYEEIINIILDEKTKIVSFDIFDTALLRPLYKPTDLFIMLDTDYENIQTIKTEKFSIMREEAERNIRKSIIDDIHYEEITIDQIYDEIRNNFKIDSDILEIMLQREIELERKLLYRRESIYNLYCLAIYTNKTIVFTSDMYLSKPILEEFLSINGYTYYDKLFISSNENATKRTGKLFEKVLEEYNCKGNEMLHIGDNWDTDCVVARKYGILATFYPKTVECLNYGISDIKSTHALDGYKGKRNSILNFEFGLKYLGNRTAIAMVANKLYDMPFKSYNEWSEMNSSPQFLGYFALGMHILGVTNWIEVERKKNNYENIVFIARDGYLPMKAYQIMKKYTSKSASKLSYFYTSRKAAFPCMLKTSRDLYGLYGEFKGIGLKKSVIVDLLKPVLDESLINYFDNDDKIMTRTDYYTFVDEILKPAFDEKKAKDFNEKLKIYFNSTFNDDSVLVDIRYSGRTQELIHKVLGKSVDAFYIHENTDECKRREKKYGFSVESFYDFTPSITGAQRELFFSSLEPSCIAYNIEKNRIKPKFGEEIKDYPYKYLVRESQINALQFVEDYYRKFRDNIDEMYMRNIDISYPFEHMMAYLENDDLKMFSCIIFEDDMWAGKSVALPEQWSENIRYHRLIEWRKVNNGDNGNNGSSVVIETSHNNRVPLVWQLYNEKGISEKNIISKMIFWLVNDRSFFWKRIKNKLIGK